MTTTLTKAEQEGLLTIALMAAFADGGKSDLERAEVKRVTESLPEGEVNPSVIYQRVLLGQTTLAEAVGSLTTPDTRKLAYELAVGVCEADDTLNEAEKRFLDEARRELRLEEPAVAAIEREAEALTQTAVPPPVMAQPPVVSSVAAPQPGAAAGVTDPEVDRMILNYSILNGALELLPESLATLAIVPLQMKMVYRVGQQYGYELDRRHITELIGAAGVGLTSQAVEGYARKILGGFLGKLGGGLARGAGQRVAGPALSFASTYALGQLAQRYYSGGRQLSTGQLKESFAVLADQARSLHGRYAGEIQQRANTLNPGQLLNLVRGQRAGELGI